MSASKSHNSSNQSSESHLDPEIKQALLGNYQRVQDKFGGMTYQPLTGSDVMQWENPYTQQVIDTGLSDLEHSRQMTLQSNNADAVAAHAFGGSRQGVADGITNRGYADKASQMIAALRSQGYDKALSTAQGENNNANQFPLLIQQLINQALGLAGNPTLGTSQGQSSGWGMSFTAPSPAGG